MRKYLSKSFKVITLLNDLYTGKPKAKLLAHPIQIDISVSNVTRSGKKCYKGGSKIVFNYNSFSSIAHLNAIV